MAMVKSRKEDFEVVEIIEREKMCFSFHGFNRVFFFYYLVLKRVDFIER